MTRLDLYKYDGSPMNPMFLAFSPPQMLPTITMNPTAVATESAASTAKAKKRSMEDYLVVPLNKAAAHIKQDSIPDSLIHRVDLNVLKWSGIAMVVFGGAAYLL
jgi:hypothetical protein